MRPLDAVRGFLRREGISGTSVTAALSGGADSVCLLHCLRQCAEAFSLEISAVHVQHGLRGEESVRDEQFCRALCADWKVPLTVIPADVKGYAAARHLSEETAARECRYQIFKEYGGNFVATAHTASDQLETMLFRLARGTGLRGLCGIPARREQYLRPLLDCTREEVEAYLAEEGLSFVTDSSNLSDAYSRNFLRHQAVPALRTLNPAAERHAAQTAAVLREEEHLLDALAQEAYASCRTEEGALRGLMSLHPALRRRCILRFLEEHGLFSTFQQVSTVENLLERGGKADLDRSGILVCYGRGTLYLERQQEECPSVPLKIGENRLFPGWTAVAELIDRENSEKFASVHKKFTDFALDYDIIKGYAELHARRPGLKLRPTGRAHTVSVKKWLNASVPPERRARVHFLSDAQGLLWAEGLGTAERARVTEQTQRMLVLHIHPINTDFT